MKTKNNYAIVQDGIKSNLLWDEDTDAWVYISGKPLTTESPAAYYRILPTLYRAVNTRAKAVASLPFSIMRGETEVTNSRQWEDPTGMIPDVKHLLWIVEASLALAGRAYLKREKNVAGYPRGLRHLDPMSVTIDENKARTGQIEFIRTDVTTSRYTPKEIVYFWYPDPSVELGPPSAWPALAALNACGVLANVDEFAKKFFSHGAIRAMLFAMDGASKDDAERFESWWRKFVSGIQNAFNTKVINAQKVAPVVVGEGIKELENVTITAEKREEIASAMDIPFTILFANAANYATAERDKLNWYEDFVIPECELIAAVINEQVLKPLNLTMVFTPENLDIFQEDEAQRAASMAQLVTALAEPAKFLVAAKILGYELDDDIIAMIEAMAAEQKANAERVQEQMAQPAQQPPAQEEPPEPDEDDADEEAPPPVKFDAQLERELSIWQSKCIAALKRGKTADSVSFVPIVCSTAEHSRIMAGLKSAGDADRVRAVFAGSTKEFASDEQRRAFFGMLLATGTYVGGGSSGSGGSGGEGSDIDASGILSAARSGETVNYGFWTPGREKEVWLQTNRKKGKHRLTLYVNGKEDDYRDLSNRELDETISLMVDKGYRQGGSKSLPDVASLLEGIKLGVEALKVAA